MKNEEKKYVYLPVSLAKKLEDLGNGIEQEKIIEKYIEECRRDMRTELDSLEEDVARFTAIMIKRKAEFRKIKEEQIQASYEIWENADEQIDEVSRKIGQLIKAVEPLENKLNTLHDKLKSIYTWDFSDMMETVGKFNGLSDKALDMMKFLFSNYKKE